MRNREPLEEIYRSGFPDDGDLYVRYFFEEKIRRADVFTLSEGGRIVSAAYVFKKKLRFFSRDIELAFFSTAATLAELRGRGLMGRVMSDVFDKYRDYPFLSLYPFKHEYYSSRYGFSNYNYLHKSALTVGNAAALGVTLSESDARRCPETYRLLSELYAKKTAAFDSYIVGDADFFELKMREVCADGGFIRLALDEKKAPKGYVCFDASGIAGEYCGADLPQAAPPSPAMMIRIINAKKTLELIKFDCAIDVKIKLNDGFYPKNDAVYAIKADGRGTRVSVSQPNGAFDLELSIESLQNLIFDKPKLDGAELAGLKKVFPDIKTFSLEVY
jgi:predicted acetyltransferase